MKIAKNYNKSLTQILTISEYLANSENPAGIIDNKTDCVIWRNEVSRQLQQRWYRQFPKFEIVTNTTNLQKPLKLKKLKRHIKRLTPIEQLPSFDYLEQEYELFFRGIGVITVTDKFYRLLFNCRNYRIFENLSASIPRGIIRDD